MTAAAPADRLPDSLSPSRIGLFNKCGLAYRFNYIDRIPGALSPAAEAGTIAHAALENLMGLPPEQRADKPSRRQALEEAVAAWTDALPPDHGLEAADVIAAARAAYVRYFRLEDPSSVKAVALELDIRTPLDNFVLRGIIDRLDDGPDGAEIVDYKSGNAPKPQYLRDRMEGIRFYALAYERQTGRTPASARLIYLGENGGVFRVPITQRSLDVTAAKVRNAWSRIRAAHTSGTFEPKPGALCDWCEYRAICPAVNNG